MKEKFPRHRQARWDRLHLVTVSTHLTALQYVMVREACKRKGVTMYAFLRRALLDLVEDTFKDAASVLQE